MDFLGNLPPLPSLSGLGLPPLPRGGPPPLPPFLSAIGTQQIANEAYRTGLPANTNHGAGVAANSHHGAAGHTTHTVQTTHTTQAHHPNNGLPYGTTGPHHSSHGTHDHTVVPRQGHGGLLSGLTTLNPSLLQNLLQQRTQNIKLQEKKYPISQCYTNADKFMCCNQILENIMDKGYMVAKAIIGDRLDLATLNKIASTLSEKVEQLFGIHFEVIVAKTDFVAKSHFNGNNYCKIKRDNK